MFFKWFILNLVDWRSISFSWEISISTFSSSSFSSYLRWDYSRHILWWYKFDMTWNRIFEIWTFCIWWLSWFVRRFYWKFLHWSRCVWPIRLMRFFSTLWFIFFERFLSWFMKWTFTILNWKALLAYLTRVMFDYATIISFVFFEWILKLVWCLNCTLIKSRSCCSLLNKCRTENIERINRWCDFRTDYSVE